ncbi:unnamed protein product [Trichogramma brassicae]|uniref:Uncharacterized protein n=1 Tax=Trichogramma brassicae TaxID=86971 RepID=A0A6H5J895_9HYME|nr:unnamed protein product [Trichogramma brassicae]
MRDTSKHSRRSAVRPPGRATPEACGLAVIATRTYNNLNYIVIGASCVYSEPSQASGVARSGRPDGRAPDYVCSDWTNLNMLSDIKITPSDKTLSTSMIKYLAWVRSPLGEFSRFVFSPGVVEPVPEVERVPLKKKTRAMSSASEAVKNPDICASWKR